VGQGAYKHAKTAGMKIVRDARLVSRKALRQRVKYKALLDQTIQNGFDPHSEKNEAMDTVGAVCIDQWGDVASGCSSGDSFT